ncbi:co-chaperone YbbN [Comamonas sp. NLF-1-9]|uniref:thioredoxin family protein n=1 Tax=Comamonas sp. NLF-1-9 TaxID=2853163 RepID=UPI001C44921C|nr:thioredoxin family protein [Comamonas sp. NLF-1-9]QXL85252.1 thioredoxin family protein [Comamonas sp. NLF-1-9]
MSESREAWWIVCLCAQWCKVCRGWRADFEALAAQQPQWRFAWVDIEDEEALVGDFDVETFPTLLLGRAGQLRYCAPIAPRPEALLRLAQGLLGPDAPAANEPEALALLQRIIASRG